MNILFTNRWVHFFLLVCMLGVALWFGASDNLLRKDLRNFAFDHLNKVYPRSIPEDQKSVIVDIDDLALQNLGQWPWSRTIIADLVRTLTDMGAAAIVFDGLLAEPDRTSPIRFAQSLDKKILERLELEGDDLNSLPDYDQMLAETIKESKVFVAGFTFSTYVLEPRTPRAAKPILAKANVKKHFLKQASYFDSAATFLPALEQASAGNGSFMANPDHDGVLRQTGLIFTNAKMLYPSLTLEAIRIATLGPKGIIKIGETPQKEMGAIDTSYRIVIGERVIPVEGNGLMRIYYRPFSAEKDYISAYNILNKTKANENRARIHNKIVFIGSSAEGLKDLRNTPLQPFRPGVEVHANVAEQIMSGAYLLRPDLALVAEEIFLCLSGLFLIVLAPALNAIVLMVFCGLLVFSLFMASLSVFLDYGVLLDPVYTSLSLFMLAIISALLSYMRVEWERKQVRGAFGMYVSPDVIRDLEKNPDKLKLGGELKDLTIVFTDIRKFTTISEGLSPEELIDLMNAFLTEMSDIVLRYGGTIDKYMGDAMMAFWNAPLDIKDHPRKACMAALQMQGALDPINIRVQQDALERGKEPVLLQAGIGINTGPCAVGNMGSRQRFAYSTLGDAVNLASRLEGQTKTYGASILVGEDTYTKASDLAFLEYDLLQVKGKTKPVRIYNLVGDSEYAKKPGFIEHKQNHDWMLQAYKDQKFKDALDACRVLKKNSPREFKTYYTAFEARIKAFIQKPPPPEWDGVYAASTK